MSDFAFGLGEAELDGDESMLIAAPFVLRRKIAIVARVRPAMLRMGRLVQRGAGARVTTGTGTIFTRRQRVEPGLQAVLLNILTLPSDSEKNNSYQKLL